MESTDRSTLKAGLVGLSWVLFFIAGMTLLVAGSAISDFAKVNRALAEVVGDSIALLVGGLGYILKRIAGDLSPTIQRLQLDTVDQPQTCSLSSANQLTMCGITQCEACRSASCQCEFVDEVIWVRKIKLIAVAWVSLLTIISCGRSSRGINGLWIADVMPSNSQVFSFAANLAQGGGNDVTVSKLSFNGSTPCFSSDVSATASFSSAGSANGFQTGSFTMKISTMFPAAVNNVLTLQGTRNSDGRITGMWTLTGQVACSGNGQFEMNTPPPV